MIRLNSFSVWRWDAFSVYTMVSTRTNIICIHRSFAFFPIHFVSLGWTTDFEAQFPMFILFRWAQQYIATTSHLHILIEENESFDGKDSIWMNWNRYLIKCTKAIQSVNCLCIYHRTQSRKLECDARYTLRTEGYSLCCNCNCNWSDNYIWRTISHEFHYWTHSVLLLLAEDWIVILMMRNNEAKEEITIHIVMNHSHS